MSEKEENLNYAALLNREMEILDYKSMMKHKLEEGEKKGRAEGEKKGREEGREEMLIDNLSNLIKTQSFTVEQALSALQVPKEQWDSLKAKLK